MENKLGVMRTVSDNAVLQRDCENVICGTAPAGKDVLLTIKRGGENKSLSAAADKNGKWQLTLPPFEASISGCVFEFSCGGEKLCFENIVFGEVFHISGQSNMELPVSRTYSPFAEQEFEYTGLVREFRVPIQCCFGKDEVYEDFPGGEWKTASVEHLPDMSAAGYWFALEIAQRYKVPVGLLNTSAGGAPVESRMPYHLLKELGGFDDILAEYTADGYMEKTIESDRIKNEKRYKSLDAQDSISAKLMSGDVSGIEFTECDVPFYFRDVPALDGFCGRIWFRKEFDIPESVDLSDGELILGAMIDADDVWLNGKYVGSTGYMYPPRNYRIPGGAAVHGRNTVLVRLDVRTGKGGFVVGKRYCVKFGGTIIDISGKWGYAVAAKDSPMIPDVFFQGLALSMYGAVTAPAFRTKARAMLWYQGESNDRAPERYSYLFGRFVEFCRSSYGYDIPVIFTQLCNFDDPTQDVPFDSWAVIRNEQLKCLDIPHTAMAVTIDVGESNDLHPLNKRAVGHRLALCARKMLFNDDTVPDDIFCTGAEYSGGKILLKFSGGVPVLKDNGAAAFEVCLENGEELPAAARNTDGGISLEFDATEKPVLVKYAWDNDPAAVLWRSDDIPVSPFVVNVK